MIVITCVTLDGIGFERLSEIEHCEACHVEIRDRITHGFGPVFPERGIEFRVCCAGARWLAENSERVEDAIETKLAARAALG